MASRPSRILFVCTGNICRSPMAEVFARSIAAQRGCSIEVRSASVLGLRDQPAHRHALHVMAEIGLDLSMHVATPISEPLMAWADHILCMEVRQAGELRERFPEQGERVALLGPFGGGFEIDDPIGGWRGRFRRSRDEISACVGGFISQVPTGFGEEE